MIFKPILCGLALVWGTCAQADPEPRSPTGKWSVSIAYPQCIAIRDYGTEKESPRLLLKASPLGDVVQVAVLREASRTPPEEVDAVIAFDRHPPLETSLMMFTPPGSNQPRVYIVNMPSADFARVRQAATFSMRSEGLNESFALSQMEPLMKVMDRCVADLRRMFNVAPEGAEPTGLQSRAKANLAKIFSSDDYPAVAVRNGRSGKVTFGLLIQEDGRVADCTIIQTSGVPSLDTQACAILKIRARFQPARGKDGEPAKDSVVGSITWRMPS